MLKIKTILCLSFLLLTLCTNAEIIIIPVDQPTIQAGIDVASDGDTVLVQPGLYVENISFTGKNITVASLFILTNDTSYISQTTIDGNQNGSVVIFENQEDESAKLIGFTIQNGLCGSNFNTTYGGGICCIQSGPTLEYLIVTENSTEQRGGGISCQDCDPIIQNCQILNNYAESWGGGINCYNSNATISECIISNNIVTSNGGGGIFCSDDSSPLIENSYISNNSANNGGGGITCWMNASPEINNVIISNNEANYDGGGIYTTHYSYPTLTNCVISYNKAGSRGGGIRPGSTVYLEAVTIKENYAEEGGGIYIYNSSSIVFDQVNRCNIYSNYALKGNDLRAGGPCIVVVDTFTVLEPTQYHIWIPSYFTFDIQHAYYDQTTSDLYVSPLGNDHNTGLSWGEPLKTIRCALSRINTTLSDATIHLGPGTYNSGTGNKHFPIPIPIYGLTLKGSGTNNTIIDAGYETHVIHMELGVDNTLSDFTVSGGLEYGIYEKYSWLCTYDSLRIRNNNGYGIYSDEGNDLTLKNLIVHDNTEGSGIYVYDSDSVFISNSILYNNHGSTGGGLYCSGTYTSLSNIEIFNNRAEGGGGAYLDGTDLFMENVNIRNNHALRGGGIYLSVTNASFSSENKCNIHSNHAGYACDISLSSENIDLILDTFTVVNPTKYHINGYKEFNSINISNSVYSQVNDDLYVSPEGNDQNSGLTSDDPLKTIGIALCKLLPDTINQRNIYIEEGLYSSETTGEFFPLSIALNNITLKGGGEKNTTLRGDSIFHLLNIYDVNNIKINEMTIENGYGEYCGAVRCYNAKVLLNKIKIWQNIAKTKGSGMYITDDSDIIMSNVCISDNQTIYGSGAIHTITSNIEIVNSTICNNTSFFAGALYQSYNSNSVIANSILWNDSPNEITLDSYIIDDTTTLAYNDIKGGESGIIYNEYAVVNYLEGNINEEPLLKPDYTLQPASPCIDAGTDYFNWQGDTIVYFPIGSYFGEAPDMGAYESGLGIGIPTYPSFFNSTSYDFRILYSYNLNPETIQIQLKELTFINFSLFDLSGREISESITRRYTNGIQNLKINFLFPFINTYPPGIYLLKMQTINSSISKKLLLH